MQMLCRQEFDIPTYHFRVNKIVIISYYVSIFWYTIYKIIIYSLPITIHLDDSFRTISQVTKTYIVCKCYTPRKFMYRVTTLGFTKWFGFNLLQSCSEYTLSKRMLQALSDNFPMVSQDTKIAIACQSYTFSKLMYKLTTLGFNKPLEFHLLD